MDELRGAIAYLRQYHAPDDPASTITRATEAVCAAAEAHAKLREGLTLEVEWIEYNYGPTKNVIAQRLRALLEGANGKTS